MRLVETYIIFVVFYFLGVIMKGRRVFGFLVPNSLGATLFHVLMLLLLLLGVMLGGSG